MTDTQFARLVVSNQELEQFARTTAKKTM